MLDPRLFTPLPEEQRRRIADDFVAYALARDGTPNVAARTMSARERYFDELADRPKPEIVKLFGVDFELRSGDTDDHRAMSEGIRNYSLTIMPERVLRRSFVPAQYWPTEYGAQPVAG